MYFLICQYLIISSSWWIWRQLCIQTTSQNDKIKNITIWVSVFHICSGLGFTHGFKTNRTRLGRMALIPFQDIHENHEPPIVSFFFNRFFRPLPCIIPPPFSSARQRFCYVSHFAVPFFSSTVYYFIASRLFGREKKCVKENNNEQKKMWWIRSVVWRCLTKPKVAGSATTSSPKCIYLCAVHTLPQTSNSKTTCYIICHKRRCAVCFEENIKCVQHVIDPEQTDRPYIVYDWGRAHENIIRIQL